MKLVSWCIFTCGVHRPCALPAVWTTYTNMCFLLAVFQSSSLYFSYQAIRSLMWCVYISLTMWNHWACVSCDNRSTSPEYFLFLQGSAGPQGNPGPKGVRVSTSGSLLSFCPFFFSSAGLNTSFPERISTVSGPEPRSRETARNLSYISDILPDVRLRVGAGLWVVSTKADWFVLLWFIPQQARMPQKQRGARKTNIWDKIWKQMEGGGQMS